LAPAVEVKTKRLDAATYKALYEALLRAFPTRPHVEETLRSRLDRHLDTIALNENLNDVIHQLIEVAETEGWLTNLLAAALESNPYDRSLRQIADKLDLASGSQPTSSRTAKTRRSQLETKSTLNPTQFSARLGEIEAQVGLIEILAD